MKPWWEKLYLDVPDDETTEEFVSRHFNIDDTPVSIPQTVDTEQWRLFVVHLWGLVR